MFARNMASPKVSHGKERQRESEDNGAFYNLILELHTTTFAILFFTLANLGPVWKEAACQKP